MSRLRLAFLSHHDPANRNSFSGTAHFMHRALATQADVTIVGQSILAARDGLMGRLRRAAGRKVLGRRDIDGARRRAALARAAARDLREGDFDAALCLTSSGLLAGLDAGLGVPLVHITDATPGYIAEDYGQPPKPGAVATERAALARATAAIYSSRFMADRAVAEFGPDIAPKLHVVPFGLNMARPPEPVLDPGAGAPRLVFIGKKWQRKGGDIALETLAWLRDRGIAAELTVIGSRPPEGTGEMPGLTVIPFLDKNRTEDSARFDAILGQAHALILPTRADCTPMVVAEANAFAVPALVSDVGGLRTLVTPGENGWLMAPEARGAAFGARLMEMLDDPADYAALRHRAVETYRQRLTWAAWCRDTLEIVGELGGARAAPAAAPGSGARA